MMIATRIVQNAPIGYLRRNASGAVVSTTNTSAQVGIGDPTASAGRRWPGGGGCGGVPGNLDGLGVAAIFPLWTSR